MKNVLQAIFVLAFFGSLNIWGQDDRGAGILSQANEEARRTSFRPKNVDAKAIKEINKRVEESIKRVRVSDPVRAKYKNFLENDRNKIAVIYPDLECELAKPGSIISVEEGERCADALQIQKKGSLYSFETGKNYLNYDYYEKYYNKKFNPEGWWDLHLIDDHFVAGNCCMQSIIANLGDVVLSSVNPGSPALSYLASFKIKDTVEEIQQQNQMLNEGILSNGYIYQKKTPVKLNDVYVVRSISYRVEKSKKTGIDHKLKTTLDVAAVFKVVGIEADKSLIIIWKKLSMES